MKYILSKIIINGRLMITIKDSFNHKKNTTKISTQTLKILNSIIYI